TAGERVQLQRRTAGIVCHLSHGVAAVTASLGIGKRDMAETGVRRVAANATAWLALMVRPRRFKESRLLPPRLRLLLGALAGALFVAFAMLVLDSPGVAFAKSLPIWLVETFNEITDFGKSGWLLVPLGSL